MNNLELLNHLKKEEWIWDYKLNDDELVIKYGLSSVSDTERCIDLTNKSLEKALSDSADMLREDIESVLVNDDDFFGYVSRKDLEDRIIEEEDYLNQLSNIVKELNKEEECEL